MSVIYALTEPSGEIRYIGKANKPLVRFKQHVQASRRGESLPVYNWIRKLSLTGQEPKLQILETCGENWEPAEIRLIAEHRAKGTRLLNVADGGEGTTPSLETIGLQHAVALSNDWCERGRPVVETMLRDDPSKLAVIIYALVKTTKGKRTMNPPVPPKRNWIASLRNEAERQITSASRT